MKLTVGQVLKRKPDGTVYEWVLAVNDRFAAHVGHSGGKRQGYRIYVNDQQERRTVTFYDPSYETAQGIQAEWERRFGFDILELLKLMAVRPG